MYVEGSYFGEMEMMLKEYKDKGRDGTAIVDSECHLLIMDQKELSYVLKMFPKVRKDMRNTARKRKEHHDL